MNATKEISEVRPAHRFDEEALADYLRANIKGFSGNEVVKSPFSFCLKIERAKRRLDPNFWPIFRCYNT